jgi:cation transport ATPase
MRTALTQKRRWADAIFSLHRLDRSSSSTIEHRLRKVNGVENVTVDFAANTVVVSYDPNKITSEHIREFLQRND